MAGGGTTAEGVAAIAVLYPTVSPSASEADTVEITATKNGKKVTKKRTVFAHSWSLKFDGPLHPDNLLRFHPAYGADIDQCGLNWPPENNATWAVGKMEATCQFSPSGIDWSARGVTFRFSVNNDGGKFSFRLHRRRIWSVLGQRVASASRDILRNEATWVYDEDSRPLIDAQNPSPGKPDRAFRTDTPGFLVASFLQVATRLDLREIAEWHDGNAWIQISPSDAAEWFANLTSVLPDGSEGGINMHGNLGPIDIPNTRPIADAGPDQVVGSLTLVTLDGSASFDFDNDPLTYRWTQVQGLPVLFDENAVRPTFTPLYSGPETFVFELRVDDGTSSLYHQDPGNSESYPDTVTISIP